MTGKHMLTVCYLIVKDDLQGYTDLCVTSFYRMTGNVRLR